MHVGRAAVLDHVLGLGDADQAAVLVVAVLAVPELVVLLDHGHLVEVVLRGRRRDHPLEAPGVPRIGAGVDLGGRDDLASFALAARFERGDVEENGQPVFRYEFRVWSYLSQATERDVTRQPFAGWIDSGDIILTRFPITRMKDDLLVQLNSLPVDSVAYDPAGGQQFAEDIAAQRFKIASMAQTYRHFDGPIGELQRAISEGRITHDGSPFFLWVVGNAVTVSDRQCRVMFDKRDSADKIDPLVASVMALARAMAAPHNVSGPLYLI